MHLFLFLGMILYDFLCYKQLIFLLFKIMITKLVISGGSINGICCLGVLQKLYESNILKNIDTFIGTSVGSYISFLLCIGYFPIDIYNILCNINFEKLLQLKDKDIDDIYDTIKSNLFEEKTGKMQLGLYSQDNLLLILKKFAIAKNIKEDITFNELYEKTNKNLVITGTCLNKNELVYFNHTNYPDMSVMTALQISSCIPFLFKPVSFNGFLWIDGACIENYPTNYINIEEADTFIGINLKKETTIVDSFNTSIEYITRVLNCFFANKYKLKTEYINNTIDVLQGKYINWDLNNLQKKELYDIGYEKDISKFLV